MVLSIIICTYNRSLFLKKCVTSIVQQCKNEKKDKLEIIIIDNNSHYNTREVINSFSNYK